MTNRPALKGQLNTNNSFEKNVENPNPETRGVSKAYQTEIRLLELLSPPPGRLPGSLQTQDCLRQLHRRPTGKGIRLLDFRGNYFFAGSAFQILRSSK